VCPTSNYFTFSIHGVIVILHFPVRLEAAGLQLWIDGNKESLQEQFGDVTEDEFCKQCASVFKKLPKEERKVW
jgi:hypothetical protein